MFASAYATNSNSTSSQNNSNTTGNCKVICRFRPLNEREKNETKDLCVDFLDPQQIVIRSKAENNSYAFSFDRTFDPNSAQNEIYEYGAKPIVESVLEGFNGTILAYGQTSSGKTHTMQGILDNPEKEGIIPRMIRHVFHHILCSSEELEYTVKVSMIEIYMEKIRDLIDLNKNNLNVREDKVKGVYIEDLSEHYVGSEDDVFELIRIGTENRTVAATMMNEQSSRSHSIFIMSIHQNNTKDLVAKTGKLYLVDLAGSEKIAKTGASGSLLDEAKTINKSLTTLGMVIMALTDGKSSHVPYRESKLTRVLQESLGGNSKTCLITTCSPSSYNECETLSTLRFGMRAKKIKNKPKINKEVTVAELKNEVDKLESLLVACNSRIIQLEKFIIKHNLTPPLEGEEDNSQSSNQVKVQSEMTQEETESRRQFEERLTNLNERKLQEIAVKYSQVIQEVNNLEDEKNEINEKLEEALARYADLTNILEMKEKTIEELRQMNNSYEKNEILLQEKLVLLNEKVMTNENRIKVSDSNKDDQLLNKMLAYIELSNSTTNEDTLNETVTSLFKVLTNKFPYLNDTASKFGNRSIIYNAGELSSIDSKHDMSLSEETIRKERDRFEKEKRIILKNLQEREERV